MADQHRLRVAVVGAGALGTLFGALLDATIISRRGEVVEHIDAHGVLVRDFTGADCVERRFAPSAVTDRTAAGPFDVVLLLNKSFDTPWAVELGMSLVATDGIVVTLQNGLRSAEVVEAVGNRGVAGTTYQGVTYLSPGVVEWTIPGPTLLAPRPHLAEAAHRFVTMASSPALPLAIAPDREAMLWSKLIAAASNSICGALALPVSAVLRTDAAWELLAQARAEGFDVAAALGVKLDRAALEPSLAVRQPKVMERATGSTYQSLASGRDDEVDEIATTICELGRQTGVATPVNDTLRLLLRIRAAHGKHGTQPAKGG